MDTAQHIRRTRGRVRHRSVPGPILMASTLFFLSACMHEPPLAPEQILGSGGGGEGSNNNTGVPCDSNVVYFNQQVLPILLSNCAVPGCHNVPTDDNDRIQITSYATLMGSDIVENGDLMEAITEDDEDDVMPRPPADPLLPEEIALIALWIQQGAQNIECDSYAGGCDTNNVTYSGTVEPLLAQKCQGCHSGPGPQGGLTFTAWSVVNTVALDGRLEGAIRHQSGYTAMPLNGAMLPQCEIDMISAWIQQGAPQN